MGQKISRNCSYRPEDVESPVHPDNQPPTPPSSDSLPTSTPMPPTPEPHPPPILPSLDSRPPPSPPSPPPPPRTTDVSIAAVDEIVDEFMGDSSINNVLLPDFIERAIYRNVLKLVLGLMGRVLDTTHLTFLGHNITMKMSADGEDNDTPEQSIPI